MIEIAWALIVILSLLMYVTLDGYDLGMGIRLLFDRDPVRRRELLEIVASAWDGNESWIILLGISLWTAFPGAYSAILPHVYLPLVASLIGLVLRGVAIEMVSQRDAYTTRGWMSLFIGGSVLCAFAQGVVFGALAQPVAIVDGTSTSSAFAFLTPYSVLTGIATVLLYTALGAGFVRFKTSGESRRRAGRDGRVIMVIAAVFILVTALSINATGAKLILDTPARVGWFTFFAVIAALGLVVAFVYFAKGSRTEDSATDRVPYLALVIATIAGVFAFGVGRYPVLLPPDMTLLKAAAPSQSLHFGLVGVGISIPFLLFYSWFAHRAFSGRYKQASESAPSPTPASTGTATQQAVQAENTATRYEVPSTHEGPLLVTLLRRTAWVVLGVLLYALCINVFSKYPQYHSATLTWIGVIALSVFAAVVWLREEVRSKDTDEEPDKPFNVSSKA